MQALSDSTVITAQYATRLDTARVIKLEAFLSFLNILKAKPNQNFIWDIHP